MSNKDTNKSLFKEVREDIKFHRYKEAIEKCKNVLTKEPNNYMGCLLIGAAYQNSNKLEAARYLRLAVEYSPGTPVVALQGLSNCATAEELPKIFEQLLALVPEKFADYYEKIYALAKNDNVSLQCLCIYKNETEKHADSRRQLALLYLAQCWLTHDKLPVSDAEQQLFSAALEVILAQETHELWLQAAKRYMKLKYKQDDIAACIRQACNVAERYPLDAYAYEWICKVHCDNYKSQKQQWQNELLQPMLHYAECLLAVNANSNLGLLVKALSFFEQQQYVAARDLLYKLQNLQALDSLALKILARAEMAIGAWRLALPLWQQLGSDFELQSALCLAHDLDANVLRQAVSILEKSAQTVEVKHALAQCYSQLNESALLHALHLDGISRAEFEMSAEEALKFLNSSEALDAESFDVLFLRGKLLIKTETWSDALVCMLKATKLKPHFAECFYYLATIYNAVGDLVRARKCYEKCVNLYPLHEQAVNTLSAMYQATGDEDLNAILLLRTLQHMKADARCGNVQYRLGLHYLRVQKWDDAIQAFRVAIKQDMTCVTYWESLGDAYAERGSYNSAIRVFQKVLEMQPTNTYAKLQMALIKMTIRMFTEAIAEFDVLLSEQHNYLPALKGAAEAHIGLASNLKSEHRYGRCKEHLQLAINYLQRAFLCESNYDMVWLWRLTAHVLMETAKLPTSLANLDISGHLAKRDTEIVYLTRQEILKLATRFYTCALKLKQNTFLWYELAYCAYLSTQFTPEESTAQLELAIKACKMAIDAQADRWQNWNLLGVIHMHNSINNLKLAQHCFIQALNLERKSYITWTNLGVLYLMLQEVKLANQAFQRAQQSSPVYCQAWIGQALIAETIQEEEEALDLFRHCQQFDYHAESALGYAHWVCSELSQAERRELPHIRHAIYRMHADIVALDAINWYTQFEENEAEIAALTYKGFLCERQQLLRVAERVYLQGTKTATIVDERDKILTNLGYLYMKLKKPHEAINAFNMVSQAALKPIIGLALAHALAEQHQESYSVYSSVLKSVADTDENKAAQILVAMAAMVYKYQGEADTKTILYQCILLKDSPIEALYAACALGILHDDIQLVDTMLSELKKYENQLPYVADIAFLTAQYLLAVKTKRDALLYLLQRVHAFPSCMALRKVVVGFMCKHYEHQYGFTTSQLALSVIELVHRNYRETGNSAVDAHFLLLAARALQHANQKRALKLIQRAIRLQPHDMQIRFTLQQLLV